MKLSTLKVNAKNPRFIKDDKFKKLVKSISDFPKMMELRPIIIDYDNVILGGNMRFRALQELKMKDIPDEWVKKASDLTDEEKKQFTIKDNVGFGEWDFDELANNWNAEDLNEWGLEIPSFDAIDIIYNEVGDAQPTEKMAGTHIPVRIGRFLMFIDESKDKKRADKIWEVFFKKYEKMSDSEKATLEEKITVALNEISSDY